jgi:hypothetical protein
LQNSLLLRRSQSMILALLSLRQQESERPMRGKKFAGGTIVIMPAHPQQPLAPVRDPHSPDHPVLTPRGIEMLFNVGEKTIALFRRRGMPYVDSSNSYRYLRSQVLEWLAAEAVVTGRKMAERIAATRRGAHVD